MQIKGTHIFMFSDICQLLHILWLVNFLLCGPLKFRAVFVAKIFLDLAPTVLNFHSMYKLKSLLYFSILMT